MKEGKERLGGRNPVEPGKKPPANPIGQKPKREKKRKPRLFDDDECPSAGNYWDR